MTGTSTKNASDRPRRPRPTAIYVLAMLGLWAALAFGVHLLVNLLNAVKIVGFPLGFYAAAQGAPVALVIMAFLLAGRERDDESAGVDA